MDNLTFFVSTTSEAAFTTLIWYYPIQKAFNSRFNANLKKIPVTVCFFVACSLNGLTSILYGKNIFDTFAFAGILFPLIFSWLTLTALRQVVRVKSGCNVNPPKN